MVVPFGSHACLCHRVENRACGRARSRGWVGGWLIYFDICSSASVASLRNEIEVKDSHGL